MGSTGVFIFAVSAILTGAIGSLAVVKLGYEKGYKPMKEKHLQNKATRAVTKLVNIKEKGKINGLKILKAKKKYAKANNKLIRAKIHKFKAFFSKKVRSNNRLEKMKILKNKILVNESITMLEPATAFGRIFTFNKIKIARAEKRKEKLERKIKALESKVSDKSGVAIENKMETSLFHYTLDALKVKDERNSFVAFSQDACDKYAKLITSENLSKSASHISTFAIEIKKNPKLVVEHNSVYPKVYEEGNRILMEDFAKECSENDQNFPFIICESQSNKPQLVNRVKIKNEDELAKYIETRFPLTPEAVKPEVKKKPKDAEADKAAKAKEKAEAKKKAKAEKKAQAKQAKAEKKAKAKQAKAEKKAQAKQAKITAEGETATAGTFKKSNFHPFATLKANFDNFMERRADRKAASNPDQNKGSEELVAEQRSLVKNKSNFHPFAMLKANLDNFMERRVIRKASSNSEQMIESENPENPEEPAEPRSLIKNKTKFHPIAMLKAKFGNLVDKMSNKKTDNAVEENVDKVSNKKTDNAVEENEQILISKRQYLAKQQEMRKQLEMSNKSKLDKALAEKNESAKNTKNNLSTDAVARNEQFLMSRRQYLAKQREMNKQLLAAKKFNANNKNNDLGK